MTPKILCKKIEMDISIGMRSPNFNRYISEILLCLNKASKDAVKPSWFNRATVLVNGVAKRGWMPNRNTLNTPVVYRTFEDSEPHAPMIQGGGIETNRRRH